MGLNVRRAALLCFLAMCNPSEIQGDEGKAVGVAAEGYLSNREAFEYLTC